MLTGTQRKELFQLQRLVYASAIGLTAGMTATMFYSLGAFIPALQKEFGWSRGDISLGATFLTLAVFISGTLAGRLCDKYGAGTVGALSLLGYAIAVAIVSRMETLSHFWIGYFCIAIVGVGSTPIAMIRPITTNFQSARGIALGIALTGAGIAGFWVPQLVTWMIGYHGWREAYLVLAGIAALVAPVVWLGFREMPDSRRAAVSRGSGDNPGLSHAQARKSTAYWLLTWMSFVMACGIAGVLVHLVKPLGL